MPGTDVITVSDHLPRRSLGMCRGEGIRALKEGMKDNSSTQASSEQSKNTETKS